MFTQKNLPVQYDFETAVVQFNMTNGLPVEGHPSLSMGGWPGLMTSGVSQAVFERLKSFKDILLEEVAEVNLIMAKCGQLQILIDLHEHEAAKELRLEILTDLADWLGDLTVFARSEAVKFGLPLDKILPIIMSSCESKLDVDGKPIIDARGKVMKGPNYWKPEPKIKELLKGMM